MPRLARRRSLWQTTVPEQPLKGQESRLFLIGVHGFAQQQVARGVIGDRQRITVALVAELELALIVGAPQVIRVQASRKWRSLGPCPGPAGPGDQTMSIQDRVNRAMGRNLHRRRQASE